MSRNRLKIEASCLDLDLSGDADFIERAYEAIRPVLGEQFQSTLSDEELRAANSGAKRGSTVRQQADPNATSPMHKVDGAVQHVAAGRELTSVQLQFVVCTDLYYRVAALSREEFKESVFGQFISPESLSKVYVDEDAAHTLRDHIEFGKTLWRELTEAGKRAIHGDSS